VAILNLIDRQGLSHRLETVEGWRVMEILRGQEAGRMAEACSGKIDALDRPTLTLAEAA